MQRAVTAIYRTYDVANQVRDLIADLGISRGYIHVVPDSDQAMESGSYRDTDSFNDDLHELHLPEDELRTYQQAVRRGDYVVSVNVDDESHLDGIMEIMRRPEDSYDIDALDEEYREAEYVPRSGAGTGMGAGIGGAMAGMGAAASGAMDAVTGRDDTYRDTDRTAGMGAAGTTRMEGGEEVFQVAEERLRVGKRNVDRGGVNIRAYTREIPVEERVTLREEHVHVERRPVSGTRVAGANADALFQDRSIEVEEHSEEAIVSKEAVVTEEIVVSKDVNVREEVVSDTVRKTEVDVERNAGTTTTGITRTSTDTDIDRR